MSESKARLGFYPDDAEALEVSRRPHRRVASDREDNIPSVASHLRAANSCLLYPSDAADDLLCVVLGGRRIIKKKDVRSTYVSAPSCSRY